MKLALIFPGIGYTCDKPLLYYEQKLLDDEYEIHRIDYGNISKSKSDLFQTFELAYQRVLEAYKDFDFTKYDTILVISKSIGTAIACRLEKDLHIHSYNILYTPIAYTFDYVESGIAFSGTKDPWVEVELVKNKCEELCIPYYLYDDCNHSLETQDVQKNLEILQEVMQYTLKFLETL